MACANQTCSSTIVGSPPNQVACARRAKIYSATYWIAIATYWLSVAGATGLIGVTEAIGQGLCKPALSVNDVQFSPINPATLARNWTAVVSVDASPCKANFRGTFQIVFTRLSETAPDMEFRERFMWMPPSVNVSVEFGSDEAVERYWIDNVSPCICRE
jgi:hypothetical protein